MTRCRFSGFMGLLLTVYLSGIAVVCGVLAWPGLFDLLAVKFVQTLVIGSVIAGLVLNIPFFYKTLPQLEAAIKRRAWKAVLKHSPDVLLQFMLCLFPAFMAKDSYEYAHDLGLVPFFVGIVLFLGLGLYRQMVLGCFSGEKTCVQS